MRLHPEPQSSLVTSHFLIFFFSVLCPQVHGSFAYSVSEGAQLGKFFKKEKTFHLGIGSKDRKREEFKAHVWRSDIYPQREGRAVSVDKFAEIPRIDWSQQVQRRLEHRNTPQGTDCSVLCLEAALSTIISFPSYPPGLLSSNCHCSWYLRCKSPPFQGPQAGFFSQ